MKIKLSHLSGRWVTPYLVMLLNLLATGIFAQVRISGKLTGKGGTGIEAASVFIKGTSTGVATDNSGIYHFSATIKPGKHTIVFSSTGYSAKEILLTVTDGNNNYTVNTELNEDVS